MTENRTENVTGTVQDRAEIADLMTGWMYRDTGEWDALLGLFHEDAQLEITWFTGTPADFVAGSRRMGSSDLDTKHLIATPVIRFSQDGDRAVSETNAVIVAEHRPLGLGCQAHSRFVDRLERRDDVWRIADRRAVYDFASFTFPRGIVDIDAELADSFPSPYAALAYLLVTAGFPVDKVFATKGDDREREIKDAAAAWLRGVR